MAQHEAGIPLSVSSERHGIARPVLSRWWARYRADDLSSLDPRSRRPHRSPTRHPPAVRDAIADARDFGWGAQRIADELGLGHGTVQREPERTRRNRVPRVSRPPVERYEKSRPGELLHLDLKYLPALEHREDLSMRRSMISAGKAWRRSRGTVAPRPRPAFSSMSWRSSRIGSRP